MTKPIVQYRELLSLPEVGRYCFLYPVDVSNVGNAFGYARTSRVVFYDALTGEIETENTFYIPRVIYESI